MASGQAAGSIHVSRERSVCASQSFLAGGVKKGPGNPISVMSAENAAARGPVTHDTPSQQPRPATPPITGERGCAPGPARPGVPVSIWPGLPAPAARHELCTGPVTVPAAEKAIAAFSRPGDLVAAPDGSLAVIEAAAAAGRRALGLSHGAGRGFAGLRARLDPATRPRARLRPGRPDLLLAPGDPDAGQAALAITGCHGPGCCSVPRLDGADGPGLLYAACERVLAPGGVLAVLTASHAPGGQRTDLARLAIRSVCHDRRRRHDRRRHAGSPRRPRPGPRTHPKRFRAHCPHDDGDRHRDRCRLLCRRLLDLLRPPAVPDARDGVAARPRQSRDNSPDRGVAAPPEPMAKEAPSDFLVVAGAAVADAVAAHPSGTSVSLRSGGCQPASLPRFRLGRCRRRSWRAAGVRAGCA